MDHYRATHNARRVAMYHKHLVQLGMDHLWSYNYIVAFFPGSMWHK